MAKQQTRPAAPIWPEDAGYDEITAFILDRNKQPIELASRKLNDFVNRCVNDPDFRHPQSEALMNFLLIVRDHLCSGINENWTLDDILAPIVKRVKEIESEQRMSGLAAINARRKAAKKWAIDTAGQLWAEDASKSIRIADMVERLWPLFVEEGFEDARPDNGETLKTWIRAAAPQYAKAGGRPRRARSTAGRNPPVS